MDDDVTLDSTALAYVNGPEFERKCTEKALERATSSPDKSSNREDDLWSSSDESDSSATTVDVDPHEPSKFEQLLYYAGICGPKTREPKLIWRDSKDNFDAPSGPKAYTRRMRLIPVQDRYAAISWLTFVPRLSVYSMRRTSEPPLSTLFDSRGSTRGQAR